jgi:hypothetical protein
MDLSSDEQKPRALILNNYSLRRAVSRFESGDYPGQHAWGLTENADSRYFEWVVPGSSLYDVLHANSPILLAVRAAILRAVGDPIQQIAALGASRPGDVILAMDQTSSKFIGLARKSGLIRVPSVAVVHHPPRDRWEASALAGHDRLVPLSEARRLQLVTIYGEDRVASPAPWGPLVGKGVYAKFFDVPVEYDFVAAGRTNRDYSALVEAAIIGGLHGIIHDGSGRIEIREGRLTQSAGASDYEKVLRDMSSSRAIVIALRDSEVLSGLTEFADAIALDKPVIVNRGSGFPYPLSASDGGILIEKLDSSEILVALQTVREGALPGSRSWAGVFSIERFRDHMELVLKQAGQG